MKKIPTLFERIFENHRKVGIRNTVDPKFEWILTGDGDATEKLDGSCCAIIDGVFYKRYDAKWGKTPPKDAVPCCEPDPVTGHWPHWLQVRKEEKGDKWFIEAYKNAGGETLPDGTYEAIGPHFCGNPYNLEADTMERHGIRILGDVPRTFKGIRDYLNEHYIEGIVFWKDGNPQCKIKRSDFGFAWK